MVVRRGDIYMADVRPRCGSEQMGRRPVIIVSHDGFNRIPQWHSLIAVPVSSSSRHRGPTVVEMPAGSAGLDRDSVALCHQVTTLDRSKLLKLLGALSPVQLEQIAEAVRFAMAI